MLAGVNFKLPSNRQLFFKRRLCIFERLNLWIKHAGLLKIVGFAHSTVHLKEMFIFGCTNTSTFFPNCYLSNLIFLFLVLLFHLVVDVERVFASDKMVF